MAIDFDELWATLQSSLKRPGSLKENMDWLLQYGQTQAPDKLWTALQKIDFEADVPTVLEWLEHVFAKQFPREDIIGLYFGTEEIWHNVDRVGQGVFMVGALVFDAEDTEWASAATYEPHPRNIKCESMEQAHQTLDAEGENNSVRSDAQYIVILCYAAHLIQACLRDLADRQEYKGLIGKNVVVGFGCGGDFFYLGQIGSM